MRQDSWRETHPSAPSKLPSLSQAAFILALSHSITIFSDWQRELHDMACSRWQQTMMKQCNKISSHAMSPCIDASTMDKPTHEKALTKRPCPLSDRHKCLNIYAATCTNHAHLRCAWWWLCRLCCLRGLVKEHSESEWHRCGGWTSRLRRCDTSCPAASFIVRYFKNFSMTTAVPKCYQYCDRLLWRYDTNILCSFAKQMYKWRRNNTDERKEQEKFVC